MKALALIVCLGLGFGLMAGGDNSAIAELPAKQSAAEQWAVIQLNRRQVVLEECEACVAQNNLKRLTTIMEKFGPTFIHFDPAFDKVRDKWNEMYEKENNQ